MSITTISPELSELYGVLSKSDEWRKYVSVKQERVWVNKGLGMECEIVWKEEYSEYHLYVHNRSKKGEGEIAVAYTIDGVIRELNDTVWDSKVWGNPD